MAQQHPPRIEFPCDYPIKVLGLSSANYESTVLAIVEQHAPGLSRARITRRTSRNSRFTAITVFIRATGPSQLEALHVELMATGVVKMVI